MSKEKNKRKSLREFAEENNLATDYPLKVWNRCVGKNKRVCEYVTNPNGESDCLVDATMLPTLKVAINRDLGEKYFPNADEEQKKYLVELLQNFPVRTETTANPVSNNVNHPDHYAWLKEQTGVEAIDICRLFDFSIGNALKYIIRAGRKRETGMTDKAKQVEDLKKAVFYLNDKINQLERQ